MSLFNKKDRQEKNVAQLKCHICDNPVTDGHYEEMYLTAVKRTVLICEYCQAEQCILVDKDHRKQEEGLEWVQRLLGSMPYPTEQDIK